MTAKRFILVEYVNKGLFIQDNANDKTQYFQGSKASLEKVVDLLNELHEENRSLKFQLDECRNHKLFSRRELEKENEQLKHKNEVLTKKIDRLLNKRKGNEETNLEIMSYLHDNYYNIWEEVLKECYNE